MAIGILPDNMLTVSEVSKLLHVHPNTLRRWADKGIISCYSVTPRGDRRFMSKDINQFLADTYLQSKKLKNDKLWPIEAFKAGDINV